MKLQRRAGIGAALVALGLAMAGAVAFACTPLSQIQVSSPTARAGEAVSVSGSAFRPAVIHAGSAITNPVTLRWATSDGPVLATADPDGHGRISASFAVPDVAPGYYVLLATQAGPGGVAEPGEPARAVLQVVGAGAPVAAPQPLSGTPVSASDQTAALAFGSVVGIVALAMAGAGAAGVARRVRKPRYAPARSTAQR